MDELRDVCARVAGRARYVAIDELAIAPYAAGLTLDQPADDGLHRSPAGADAEALAAHWLTLDAINFGSGWFPTLRKRDGLSGYNTIAVGWHEHGTLSAAELAGIDASTVAEKLGQDPGHELMALYAGSLRDLAAHVIAEHGGSFLSLAASTPSAVGFARRIGRWPSFADVADYGDLAVPFLKRAQIAAADLHRAGVTTFADLDRLTMFADNLVPHVLRLDGILHFTPGLVARIDRGELIEHGSLEEVEIRACALHAVELIVTGAVNAGPTSAQVDEYLWNRGQLPRYKAVPRHRSRCTAY
jgi:putative queuosine salvage protein